jgi:Skp family chaperone for outer membrane proteins
VKKAILVMGLATLMLGLTSRLQAQPSGTRVAIVNVGLVFSKYEKAIFYKQELETTLKPFKVDGEKIAAQMKLYGEPLKEKKVTDPKMKDDYEQYLLRLKREMEDLDVRARKLIGKKQEDQIITLYKEVIGAIQAFAQDNKYQLVLGYGQQIEGDPYSFANINRIMQRDGPRQQHAALHIPGWRGRHIAECRRYAEHSLPVGGWNGPGHSDIDEKVSHGCWRVASGRLDHSRRSIPSNGRREREEAEPSLPADHRPFHKHPGRGLSHRQDRASTLSTGPCGHRRGICAPRSGPSSLHQRPYR